MNIIISGGTSGIGKELALLLSMNKNDRIIVTGRNKKALKELSSEAEHGNIFTSPLDLEEFENQYRPFLDFVTSRIRRIDILINNAGCLVMKDFMEMNASEAKKMMDTNFFGPAALIRVLKPMMKRGSHIVNISSMGGYQGSSKYRGLSYYSASKAALSCLSECLAEEFRESGIAVNCLALGSVSTKMQKLAFPGFKAPLTAREMAEFIAGFAISGGKFFNGKVLPVALSNP
ncbi:MAG: SDR family oxidoreductase [Bacteroidales bacterium]|jgi:NAD(P)-dependent dehydrogenase (short-subunit alcohol dehydrogenase family)